MPVTLGPSRWKRLFYSILSVLLGVFLFSFFLSLTNQFGKTTHLNSTLLFEGTLLFGYFALLFSLPGWLLALSFVLTVANYSRWRFVAFWAIGTATGPIAMLATSYVMLVASTHTLRPSAPQGFWSPFELPYAAAVACLVTLIYLLLVRFDQRRARLRQTNNAAQSDPATHTS